MLRNTHRYSVSVRSDCPACVIEWVIVSTIDSVHLEVGDGGDEGLKKRVWSDDEKRTVCAQALTAGVSVTQVPRRYAPLI
jgi:hypothetical protein